MFVSLIWALLSLGGAPVEGVRECGRGVCITLEDWPLTAEAGLCVAIPCSFTSSASVTLSDVIWYKCAPLKQRCSDSGIVLHPDNRRVQSAYRGRVSLLEPDVSLTNCSIIINDLTEADSGLYQPKVVASRLVDGFTFPIRASVSVKALKQRPTVTVPPLVEGQQTSLTCTAPGLCSGSDPTITWNWRKPGEDGCSFTENITAFRTENVTAVRQRHSSTLTFNLSSELYGTEITCKVGFANGVTTEETVTLKASPAPCGSSTVLSTVAALSLIVNVVCIACLLFLWKMRRKVEPKEEDQTYMTLQKNEISPDYDVIGQAQK